MDLEGQYLIACGLIRGIKWLIAGIYASQIRKVEFFNQLIKALEHYSVENIIMMGDFNAVMDLKKNWINPLEVLLIQKSQQDLENGF